MRRYLAVAVWSFACAAFALIKVEFPVSRTFAVSDHVCVGTVVEWNADMKVATVKVDAVYKGPPQQEHVRIQFAQPDGLAAQMSAGSPVVMFLNTNSIGIVHAADTWLQVFAIAGMKPQAWRTAQVFQEGVKGYPGRTLGVARLAEALKDGRHALDDEVDPEGFAGKARESVNVGAKPTFLAASDVDGDGRLDLVIGIGNGVRLYTAKGRDYAEVTAGARIGGVKAGACAAGDINGDGKVDLLLGKTLWLGGGGTFKQAAAPVSAMPDEVWVAGAINDVTGDGKADIAVLMKGGGLLVLENPGSTDKEWAASRTNLWVQGGDASAAAFSAQWGDDGELCLMVVRGDGVYRYGVSRKSAHVGDMVRLTGFGMASCEGLKERPIRAIAAVAWDSDGNRKADFLAIAETGGLMLMNRGLGVFLLNNGTADKPATHEKVRSFSVGGQTQKVSPGSFLAAGPPKPMKKGRQSLFVACPDGRVFELE